MEMPLALQEFRHKTKYFSSKERDKNISTKFHCNASDSLWDISVHLAWFKTAVPIYVLEITVFLTIQQKRMDKVLTDRHIAGFSLFMRFPNIKKNIE